MKLAVFCDGDFWHGRHVEKRIQKLQAGHNAGYWVAKIVRNVERDAAQTAALRELGWTVMRFWETDIVKNPKRVAGEIVAFVAACVCNR